MEPKLEHSVIKALKTQLLEVILERDPEASVQIFAMAAMHGDVDTLNMIIDRVGDKLGNLEEMVQIRDGLELLVKDIESAESRQRDAEAAAAAETQALMKKLGL